jgi:hypothetical protein
LFQGSEQATFDFFRSVALQIQRRVDLMCSLPLEGLDHGRRERATRSIGEQANKTEQKET